MRASSQPAGPAKEAADLQRQTGRQTGHQTGPKEPDAAPPRPEVDRLAPGDRLARAQRLGHRPPLAITPDRDSGAAQVRRSFGFEIELDLALGWADENDTGLDKARYSAPDTHLTKYPVAATATGFEVHLDHSADVTDVVPGSNAIVELVTKPPIDESTAKKTDVEARMQQMLDFVGSADAKTSSLAGRGKLGEVTGVQSTGAKDGFLFVGGEKKGGQQLATGYVQNTTVVKLSKLPAFFSQVKEPSHTAAPIPRAAAKQAEAAALSVTEFRQAAKLLNHGWKKDESGDTWTSAWGVTKPMSEIIAATNVELPPLLGLLSLLVNQLVIGRFMPKHPTNALLKNHLGLLFYKSKLSNARNALTGGARWYLDDPGSRAAIKTWVLARGLRTGAEDESVVKLIPGSPKVGDWVDAVLAGTGDPLYDAAANPYSSEIAPYEVGPEGGKETGVALESRKTSPSGGYTYPEGVPTKTSPEPVEHQNDRPVGDWKALAVAIWKRLRALNDIPDEE